MMVTDFVKRSRVFKVSRQWACEIKYMALLVITLETNVPVDLLVSVLSSDSGFSLLGDWVEYHQQKFLERGLTPDSHPWRSLVQDCAGRQVYRVSYSFLNVGILVGHLDEEGMIIGANNCPPLTLEHPTTVALKANLEKVAVLKKFEAA